MIKMEKKTKTKYDAIRTVIKSTREIRETEVKWMITDNCIHWRNQRNRGKINNR